MTSDHRSTPDSSTGDPPPDSDHSSESGSDFIPVGGRFRGFMPVVVDVETGGFNSGTDALLEVAAVLLGMRPDGQLQTVETHSFHVAPFEGANIEPASLEVNGIDPHHPLRPALPEKEALSRLFREVRRSVSENNCNRAVLVGHNAHFDLGFVNAAAARTGIKRNPFHPFSVFDTATLAGVALGQTVLRRAVEKAGLAWDGAEAHSARYDTERTAVLFCEIVNRFQQAFGRYPA
ncbi:MAG: ribonuclease T [Salinisphaeraceae bacterium]|jgi:ribonuclease T|nr:ribonuclease T [Salinisphaeraceae bacterium]